MNKLDEILEDLFTMGCLRDCDNKDTVISVAKKQIIDLLPNEKPTIEEYKYQCCDDPENCVDCLYDVISVNDNFRKNNCIQIANGIAKEKCPYYQKKIVIYEDWSEYNQAIKDCKEALE